VKLQLITAVAMCNCFSQSVRYNYPTLALMPFKEGRVLAVIVVQKFS